jgi:hypothetical protein
MDASRSNIRVESAETGEVFLLRREPTYELIAAGALMVFD